MKNHLRRTSVLGPNVTEPVVVLRVLGDEPKLGSF